MKNFLKKSKFLLFVPLVLTLSSCSMGDAFGGVESKLWPNLWITLAQLLAFCVMALVVFFVGYKPIKKNLNSRRDKVAKTVRDAEDKLIEAELKESEADKNIKNSHKVGEQIIEESRNAAENEAKKIISEAEEIVSKRLEQANKDIKQAKIKMEQEINNQIISSALEASKEILQRELTSEDNDKIVEEFIKKSKK